MFFIYALDKYGVCHHRASADEEVLKDIIVERYEGLGFKVNVDKE